MKKASLIFAIDRDRKRDADLGSNGVTAEHCGVRRFLTLIIVDQRENVAFHSGGVGTEEGVAAMTALGKSVSRATKRPQGRRLQFARPRSQRSIRSSNQAPTSIGRQANGPTMSATTPSVPITGKFLNRWCIVQISLYVTRCLLYLYPRLPLFSATQEQIDEIGNGRSRPGAFAAWARYNPRDKPPHP
jgi:hypothetical protein